MSEKEKINFNLVESSSNEIDEIYPTFKKDFLNPMMTVERIRKKYGIGKSQYKYLRQKVLNETNLKRKPTLRGGRRLVLEDSKYLVHHLNGTCSVFKKNEDGYMQSYGKYPSFGIAVYVRDKLIESYWDEDLARELKKEYSKKEKK